MAEDSELDELFANEVEVGPSAGANPRVVQVIAGLLVVGVLVGILASVIISGLSTVRVKHDPEAVDCGAAICKDLTLEQVRTLTGIDLPPDTEVVASRYAETDDLITVTAEVALPDGAENPFEGTNYAAIDTPSQDWRVDDLEVFGYYAASGENGALNAEAVFALNDHLRVVVLVRVARVTG